MSKKTILITDDQDKIREALSIYLQNNTPYIILEAKDGYEALEIIKNQTVDLLLLDLNMPGLSGRDVIKQAKNIKPIINITVVSGWDGDEITQEVKELGADHFINKPYQMSFLKEHIEQQLK